MTKLVRSLYYFLLLLIIVSCDGFKFSNSLFDTSARAKYERGFEGPDSLMLEWKNHFENAAGTKLNIADGFSAVVDFKPEDLHVLAYQIELQRGDLLIIEADGKGLLQQHVFVDVQSTDAPVNTASSKLLDAGISTQMIENSGLYRIIIQPEILFSGTFNVKIYTQPSMTFPVAGKANSAVQSFWGAERDGGARRHEGVDIFATRGTPVVAAVNGIVTRTGNQGLGGKQVWLRDLKYGNSLYYAHLDSVMTTQGSCVKPGETLGTVGSTGNAEGGSPHLHFGIYSSGGAVDPWPFVRKRAKAKNLNLEIPNLKTLKRGTNLRSGPGTSYEVVKNLSLKTKIRILATDGEWFHIRTDTGSEGFVLKTRLE